MKHISITIGGVLLIVNISLGLLLSSYPMFNWILNSIVIILLVLFLYIVSIIKLKGGYRVALNCLFPCFAIIEYICGLFADDNISNNFPLIIILLIITFQVILLFTSNYLSKKNNSYMQT